MGGCDPPLDAQKGQQCQVGLLVEAEDTVPVHVIVTLAVQSIEGEKRRVEARQQDGQQQRGAAHHNPEETSAL